MSGFLRRISVVLLVIAACFAGVRIYAAGTGSGSSLIYTLNDDGAKIAAVPHSFAIGSVAQLSSLPYKPGYGFAGYYTGSGCTGNQIIDYTGTVLVSLGSSTILYACWYADWFHPSIVLDDAGGSGGMMSNNWCSAVPREMYYNGNSVYVTFANRSDWAIYWEDSVKSGPSYGWTTGCSGSGNITQMYHTPTRSGYTFRGYYTGQNGTGTQIIDEDGLLVDAQSSLPYINTGHPAIPTQLYAYWEVDNSGNYLITLNDAGGSGSQVGGNAFLHLYEIYGECYASAISQNSNGTLSGAECIQAIHATPTKTGYNFGGYYTGQNGTGQQIINASGTIVGSNTYFTSAATIHAKWTPKIYTVTLNHQSATNSPAPSTVYVKHGTGWYSNSGATTPIYSMTTIPVRTNYNFAGYYTGTNGTGTRVIDSEGNFLWTSAAINAITSNTTIYAYWVAAGAVPNWVTVTLNDNGQSTYSQYNGSRLQYLYRNTDSAVSNCSGYKLQQSCNATTVTHFTPPTKSGYAYGGHYTGSTQWSDANGNILVNLSANTTVTAQWTQNSGTIYTVTLYPNGGTGSNLLIYERQNIGWYRDSGGTYQITSSIFNLPSSGGAGLTQPTYTNHVFNGYWTGKTADGATSCSGTQMIDANGNILASPSYGSGQRWYACWVGQQSTVALNANGGTACATTSVTAIYGSAMPTLSCAPTAPTGYHFDGYWDSASGGTQYYHADLSSARNWDKTGAQTLYAHWQPTVYDVIYYCTKEDFECYAQNPNDPNCHAYHDVATYNQSYVFKTRAFVGCAEITGQKFFGWEADDTGSSILYQPGQVITYTFTSDKGLSGTYQPIVPVTLNHGNPNNTPSFDTVYLVPTDGWYSNSSATIGAIFETLPEKYGYEFLGYWTATTGGTKVIDANGDFLVNVFDSGYPSSLYARYSEKIYTINLNDQGATTASAPNPVAYSITRGWFNPSTNATITAITPPTKTGKYFDGFLNDNNARVINHDGTFETVTSSMLQDFHLGDTTLWANWIDQNTVTFSCENQAGDGSGTPNPTTVQIHSGETLTFPSMANCSWGNAGYSPFLWGYVVNGGFTDTHDAGDTITWDSSWGNRTYNMWYAPNYFNYEYSCGTGTGTPPASGNTYYHSNWSTAANTCTKTGYTFAGWKEPVSNEIWPESTTPTNGYRWPYDVTAAAGGAFTAQWTASTYSISYTLNGGTAGANAPTSGTYDSVVTISNPTHAHATFTGWTVTGMDNGTTHYYGTANPPTSTTTGTSISTPTKATYYKNLRSVSGTVTFTAVWECNAGYTGTNCNTQVQYPLTWSCGDASGTPSGASFPTTITYGGTLTFPSNPCGSIVGHTFTGWVVDVNATQYNVGSTLTWPFTSGSAITAHYDPVKVNITYSCGGTGTTGSPSKTADNNIDYGSQVTLATLGTCAKAGNTATKWVVSGTNDNYDFGANVTHWNYTENKTLVPNWSAQTYNIIYKDEDGTTELTGLTPSSYTYGTSTTINAVPTKLHSVFNGWCTGYNTSTKTPTGCTNPNTPLIIGPTETGIKTFYASWSCDAGYIKYADADLYEYIEYGVSDAHSYKARDCAPGYFHLYCNAHGGVACLEQFTINNKTYHFGEVYNTQAIRNSGMYGLLVSGNPVAVSSGTGGAQFGHSNSYSVSGLCLASGFPNCDNLLDANATYSDWLDALASATGTTWGLAHHTFNGLWSQETGGTQYLAPNTPLAAMGFDASNNMNLPTLFTSDATLHAQWIPDVYMVSLEANGGNPGALTAVYEEYGNGWARSSLGPFGAWTQITGNEFPTRPGYTFAGYYDTSAASGGTKYINADGTLASGITPTSIGQETALYARWTAKCNAVILNPGEGSAGSTVVLYKKTGVATLYTDNDCSTQYTTSNNVIPSRDGWTFRGFHVTNYADVTSDNAAKSDQVIKTDGSVATYNSSWTISGDTTLYAAWAKNCTVPANGTCNLSVSTAGAVDYTTGCSTGYTLSGNNTAIPTCSANCNEVTLNPNGGTAGTRTKLYKKSGTPETWYINSGCTTTYGSSYYSSIVPVRAGYKLRGFYTSQLAPITSNATSPTRYIQDTGGTTNTGNSWNITSNQTLYAAWAEDCTAPSHGTCNVSISGNSTTYSASCDDGYTVSGATTSSPQCTANTITINWDENGGGAVSNGSCTYDENLALATTYTPSYANHVFNGWKFADGSYHSAGQIVLGGCVEDNLGVTSGTSTAIQAKWCAVCAPGEHAHCELDATTTPGTCIYTTYCDTGYTISGNGTATPTCTANTNTITLNGNGATGGKIKNMSMTNGSVTFTCTTGSSISLPTWSGTDSTNTTSIVLANKVFKGWAESSNATAAETITTCPTGSKTYYAVWKSAVCQSGGTGVASGYPTVNSVSGNAPVCNMSCNPGYSQSGGTDTTTSGFTRTGTAGTETFKPNCTKNSIFTVTMDSKEWAGSSASSGTSATTAGAPTTVYLWYNNGWYSNSGATTAISSMSTKPKLNKWVFNGYYTGKAGSGTQIVNSSSTFLTTATVKKSYTANGTAYADYTECTCTKGTNVSECSVTGTNDSNQCTYSYTCAAGYNNSGASSGTFTGGTATASNPSPNCATANSYTITVKAGNGISTVAGSGWTNTGTATMSKSYAYGSTITLSSTVTPTQKNGYTGVSYSQTSGSGTLSNGVFTVGAGDATITAAATGIKAPASATISGGTTKTYNYQATDLTASATAPSGGYDSGISYKYAYANTPTATSSTCGTYGSYGSYGTSATMSVAKAAYLGYRCYKVKVVATDGTLTSSETEASSGTTMGLIKRTITFNVSSNGGTISGTSPLYAGYGDAKLYTGATGTTEGSVPSATKIGYTFKGWYDSATGGNQVYDANGTLKASVSGYTNSTPQWVPTANKTLYAQFDINSYTITVKAGNGVSKVTASGWTGTGTATLTRSYNYGSTITLSDLVPTRKTGYTGAGYTKTSGEGTINSTTFTVGAGAGEITVSATGISAPTASISGGADKIYNYQDTTLTGTNTTSYDSGITVKYSFGYSDSANGTYGNWTSYGTGNTTTIGKTAYRGTRYYKVKVQASDGTLTSEETVASSAETMTLVNRAITFDASTNHGTLSGTSPLYVWYNNAGVVTSATGTAAGTVPSASKANATFNGWYTAATNGSQIYNASGTLTSSAVSGYTSGGKWVTTTARTLYAQFSCNEGYGYNSGTDACEAYTITFKTGNGTMGTQLCAYGENVALNAVSGMTNIPVAANKGWSFDGWATSVNTTTSNYANQGTMTCNGNATLYGIWKRDVKFTYYETATSTSKKTSTSQQYYRNTTSSAAGVNSVDTYPLYAQSDYAWSPLGWATTTSATSASTSQTGATTTTVSPALGTGSSTGVAYYAIYSRTPQIAYNGNGNTGGSTANTNCGAQTFNAGATNGSTPTCTLANNGFTRTGYTFDKWAAGGATGTQYSEGDAYTFTNKTWTSAKTYTMYANWKNNHYRITLNDAGGNGGQAAENPAWGLYERYGSCYIAAQVLNNTELEASVCVNGIYATPSRTGYDFGGYYTGENGSGDPVIDNLGTIVAPATQFTEDSTVYAKWTPSTYNINYVFNGGSALPSGYTPVEYIQGAGSSYINTGVMGYGNWQISAQGVTAPSGRNAILVAYGTSATSWFGSSPNNRWGFGPTNGLYFTNVNFTDRIDLDVTFASKSAVATINGTSITRTSSSAVTQTNYRLLDYGSYGMAAKLYGAKFYKNNELAFNGVPARYGNVCGLYDTVSGTFFPSATTTNFTCPNTEYIGGYPDSYTYGVGATINGVPTRANSTFVGWCENSGLTNNCVTPQSVSTTATGDKTFYAKWTCNTGYTANSGNTACNPNTINLTYVSEHGTAPQAPASCVYNQNVTLPVAVTANGYTFSKWGVAGNQFDANETIVCNSANLGVASGTATITAVWTTNDYTMQYVCSDGTESANWSFDGTAPSATNPVHYGQSVSLAGDQAGCRKIWGTSTDPDYCVDCFTFGGWTIDAEGTALGQNVTHNAGSSVNPWGNTNNTDWCIIDNTSAACEYFTDNVFYVAPIYTPKQYDIEYMYATSPSSGASANMPASYTYTMGGNISNADQTPPAHATFNGWCTDLNDQTTCVGAGQAITIGNRDHGNRTYYANWSCDTGYDLSYNANNEPVCSASSITCDPTQYLPANSVTCVDCTAGNYCPGGTFTFNENNAQGINICPAGSFCPAVVANHTLCAIGSYTSTTGQSACIACNYGITTTSSGQTSCNADCANAEGAQGWETAVWNANNTVTNSCTLNACEGSYYPIINNTGNECALCEDFADGTYPHSSGSGVSVYQVVNNYEGDGRRACFVYRWEINGYHIANNFDMNKTACAAGFYSNYSNDSNLATHFGEHYDCDTCPDNTYSTGGATQCTACLTNYTTYGPKTSSEACRIYCAGGYYIRTANDTECSAVGAGHWAAGAWTIQGQAGSYTNCAAGLTTIGYGVGADEAGDCGRVLHVGANHIYLRSDRKTDKTLNVKIGGTVLYGNMANAEVNMSNNVDHSLKIKVGNTTYSVYDDSGEVYIGTSGGSGITINPNIAASSTTPSSYNTASGMSWSAEVDEMTVSGTGGCSTTTGSNGDISAAGFSPNGSGTGCWCQITSPTQSNRWVYATTNSSCSTKCGFYCANNMKGTNVKNITYRTNLYSVSDLL